MKTIRKLRTISDLQMSGYGQPPPRHGLQLLFWFAKDCIWENEEEMFLACDPSTGHFGFHPFENRQNCQGKQLLPDVNFLYYEVGNLNSAKAKMLPDFVKRNAANQDKLSNTDRIIFTALERREFGKIYITKHCDQSNFDENATCHVSRNLLKAIRLFPDVKNFMRNFENKAPINYQMCMIPIGVYVLDSEPKDENETKSAGMYYVHNDTKPSRKSCCTIL